MKTTSPRTAPVESPRASAVEYNNGHTSTCPRTVPVESPRLQRCTTTGIPQPCPRTATVEHPQFSAHVAPKLSARNGHEDNLIQNCTCGISTGFNRRNSNKQVATNPRTAPVESPRASTEETATSKSPPTQELHLWNLHGLQQFSTTAQEH